MVNLLLCKNGFFGFENALHLFPSGYLTKGFSLEEWNAENGWRSEYGHQAEGLFFFAEDIFGSQFAFNKKEIVRFDPETGDCEPIAMNFEEWAALILNDYNVETGYSIAHDWQKLNGPLEPTQRLIPRVPFVLGGDFKLENLCLINSKRGMCLRANLARQIKEFPDGSKIKFEIVE